MKTIQQIIHRSKWTFHLIFSISVLIGLGAGAIFMYLQGYRFENNWAVGVDCVFFLLCIYTGRWLINRWYLRHKLWLFIVVTLLSVLVLTIIKWLIVRYIFNHPFAGLWELALDVMPFFLVGLVMGMLFKFIRFSLQKEVQDAQANADQKQSEFNLLQAQLSPHFLFNVLNNLYGISIEEPDRIPTLLLKLSSLLRYSVYKSKKTFVPLVDEIDYIRTYINFEQIRISDRLILQEDMEQNIDSKIKIAPLVLIVFVENAFKHAKNTFLPQIQLIIRLKISDDFIHFSISNSYYDEGQSDDSLPEERGIGLANTIRRLNLIYGANFELIQEAVDNVYTVQLKLKIQS